MTFITTSLSFVVTRAPRRYTGEVTSIRLPMSLASLFLRESLSGFPEDLSCTMDYEKKKKKLLTTETKLNQVR